MIEPPVQVWSFAYALDSGRYSFEIEAPTRDKAESALRSAICEGAIEPMTACDARQSRAADDKNQAASLSVRR